MTTMHIDFANLKKILPALVKCRKPLMFRGPHGIGKSQLVYWMRTEVPQWLGVKGLKEYPVVERRASQMADAGDLMGLPYKDGDATAFSPMVWFKQACEEPVILFLDEVDRANSDVRQAIFELTDSRKIAGHSLHPDTIVVACVNGGADGSDYQVGEMDPAELDRWTVFDVKPSVEDWLTWAKGVVCEHVYEYIRANPQELEHDAQAGFEPNVIYPSRRSWVRFNECLSFTDFTQSASPEMIYLGSGFIGADRAISFHEFVKNFKKQVTVEELLNNSEALDKTESFEMNEHLALIGKLEDSDLIKEALNSDQIENLARYFLSLQAESAMKVWEVVTGAYPENGVALHGCEVDGGKVKAYIKKINGGGAK